MVDFLKTRHIFNGSRLAACRRGGHRVGGGGDVRADAHRGELPRHAIGGERGGRAVQLPGGRAVCGAQAAGASDDQARQGPGAVQERLQRAGGPTTKYNNNNNNNQHATRDRRRDYTNTAGGGGSYSLVEDSVMSR
eukprot:1180311-Prorocentrum_minimum.AAC.1